MGGGSEVSTVIPCNTFFNLRETKSSVSRDPDPPLHQFAPKIKLDDWEGGMEPLD